MFEIARPLTSVVTTGYDLRGRRRRGLIFGLAAAVLCLSGTALAAPNVYVFGRHYLDYGFCCSNQRLDGTRANVLVTAVQPQTTGCVLFDSVVSSNDSSRQLEVGNAKCGSGTTLDGTCSTSNNYVLYVERIPTTGVQDAVCYPHGQDSVPSYHLFTVDSPSGNGTWQAYIDGSLEEGQSGYTNQVRISEWGEDSQHDNYSCSGWGGTAYFDSWQRYNYPNNQWTTVQQASTESVNNCWSVTNVSNGSFSVSH